MNKSYSKIRHIQETNMLLEKRLLSENAPVAPTTPTTTTSTDPKQQFVDNNKDQMINFYLPDDKYKNLPIIAQFKVTNIEYPDQNTVIIQGDSNVGSIKIKYRCDGTNDFIVQQFVKADQNWKNKILQFLDFGLDNEWKELLAGFAELSTEKLQARPNERKAQKSKMTSDLIKAFPNTVIRGGTDQTGTNFVTEIQNLLCGRNAVGAAVPRGKYQ
jgi:hypothetical protein